MADREIVKLEVMDQAGAEELAKMAPYLSPLWCKCEESSPLCYTQDGQCPCGVFKHHVHCRNCGAISQVG